MASQIKKHTLPITWVKSHYANTNGLLNDFLMLTAQMDLTMKGLIVLVKHALLLENHVCTDKP